MKSYSDYLEEQMKNKDFAIEYKKTECKDKLDKEKIRRLVKGV